MGADAIDAVTDKLCINSYTSSLEGSLDQACLSEEFSKYLIIGSGRVANHFQEYFRLLEVPFASWSRKKDSLKKLKELFLESSHILLLISDSAIKTFYEEIFLISNSFSTEPKLKAKIFIHFSGALELPGIIGAHPLMTFNSTLYDLKTYLEIPFILTEGLNLDSQKILPGLRNKIYFIKAEQRPLYHALCVLSGNFSTLLWQKMFRGLGEMGLSHEAVQPYLKRIFENISENPYESLTGPLVRRDFQTINKNLEALKGDPYQKIYEGFLQAMIPEFNNLLKKKEAFYEHT